MRRFLTAALSDFEEQLEMLRKQKVADLFENVVVTARLRLLLLRHRRRTTLHSRTTRQAIFAQLKQYVTSLPRTVLPTYCLQTAIVDPETDKDVLNSESILRSRRFCAFLNLLAEHSDVVFTPKRLFPTTNSIHLQSEDVPTSDDY